MARSTDGLTYHHEAFSISVTSVGAGGAIRGQFSAKRLVETGSSPVAFVGESDDLIVDGGLRLDEFQISSALAFLDCYARLYDVALQRLRRSDVAASSASSEVERLEDVEFTLRLPRKQVLSEAKLAMMRKMLPPPVVDVQVRMADTAQTLSRFVLVATSRRNDEHLTEITVRNGVVL
jgi:hypothetical protein